MKISPIASSQAGAPGVSINPIGGSSVSQDKREAAKQAFLGQSPANIAPSDTPVDPQVAKAQASIRKIKMKTQVSTDRYEQPQNDASSATEDNVEQTQVVEATKPVDPQVAAFAKARRALQVKESEIAAREKALSEQKPSGIDLAQLKANPLAVMLEAGVTYDQLAKAVMDNQANSSPEVQALQAKVAALEKGLETKFTERDANAEKQVLSEIRRETNQLVATGEDYAMIRSTDSQSDVVDLIHRTWQKTGEVLDTNEAAKLVENYLVDEALKIANIEKIKGRLTPAQVQQVVEQRQQGMRTLTNKDSAAPIVDRRQRALAAFYGNLKK